MSSRAVARRWTSVAAVLAVATGTLSVATAGTRAWAGEATIAGAHQRAPQQPRQGRHHRYVAPKRTKINVMGEWAHPDDDTSIIGPCGVWHQRYGTRCGVIQITRGEGGGNATGPESGQALGLRRENEDRVAHRRSGTVDMFYVDRVDFFYNQSAPLTNRVWDHHETLRRVTRIVRTTQPDVFVGWTPTLAAGHGNHQEAGRLIWEAMAAAADPTRFPGQLRGKHALSTWKVKKVYSGGSTAGTGGTTSGPRCTTGFVPAAGNPDTVAGVWTGYRSPYDWPRGNVQGQPAGTAKTWAQVAAEGASAYPTQSRVMYQGAAAPACPKFAQTHARVPFQPNTRADGSPNPLAGRDDALLQGATVRDPGGLPLGTLEWLSFSDFYVVPGQPFTATLHVRSGKGTLKGGRVHLGVPDGWTVQGPSRIGRIHRHRTTTARFTVTPPADATTAGTAKVSALLHSGRATGYTDDVVQPVPAVEGRFQRFGKWKEYDEWLTSTPAARRLGRSGAEQSVGLGRSVDVPVDVHNWSDETHSGTVSLQLPDGFTADRTSQSYGPVAAGKSVTVHFAVRNTMSALPANQQAQIPVRTTSDDPAGSSSSDTLLMSVVPTTAVPEASTSPQVDGTAGAAEYPGDKLDIGRIWQGGNYCTGAADCGSSAGGADGSWAEVSWHDDALYVFTHIRDDYQSYAVKPNECTAHWLADSVELQIDPRGQASQDAMDTAETFKLGVFPFTDDPSGSNGNGANGPCWERDADQHQGYATGPLADTVADAPNAAGVQVASTAHWVGDDKTTTDHSYAGGGYDLEIKVPMADLPAAVDPSRMGLNITPYDEDDTSAPGSTTLRHIDNSARLAWSAFGSVQSDPYRWGLATLPGYTPPSGRSATPQPPVVGHPNLDGTQSPQTIWQSARNRVPIAGRVPVTARDRITALSHPKVHGRTVRMTLRSSGRGTAEVFGYAGRISAIPVFTTSCTRRADPPPDYGLTPCATSDGGTPAWSPDMSGHLLASRTVQVHRGRQRVTLRLTADEARRFARTGRSLVSFTTPGGRVQALDRPVR